jgi:hypothetical protein
MIEIMKKIEEMVKPIAGYALVSVAGLLVGLFIALHASGESCYLEILLGENKISILKPDVTDYDYNNLPEHKASALSSKLKTLEWDDNLSVHLRDLRDSYRGPFQKKVIEVYVRFTDDGSVKYPNAGGFRGELMNQELSIFKLVEPKKLRNAFSHKSFQVMIESSTPDITGDDSVQKTIWIDKKYACEWLHIEDEAHLPEKLLVKASILRRVASPPSEGVFVSMSQAGKI